MKHLSSTLAVFLLFLAVLSKALNAESPTSSEYISSKGEEFIFTNTYPGGEKYGYLMWHKKPEGYGGSLSYDVYCGRKGKLEPGIIYSSSRISKFRRAILENGEILYVNIIGDRTPDNIYFLKEMDSAKALIGHKVWINHANVVRPIELITPDRNISFLTHHLEVVTVTDVVLDRYGHERGVGAFFIKVRKASGEEGLLKFHNRYLCASDPFPSGTPKKIIQAVKQQEIILGMTSEQAKLSWGEPDQVNKSVGSWGVNEQWVYGNQYLYFSNGKLTSFQTSN